MSNEEGREPWNPVRLKIVVRLLSQLTFNLQGLICFRLENQKAKPVGTIARVGSASKRVCSDLQETACAFRQGCLTSEAFIFFYSLELLVYMFFLLYFYFLVILKVFG